ncbi:XTP/dITP diphosphatase [Candidatus Contubernalis alkaliaceticus]|uniref:XTP/dITP diphosphatase n=1 Tax=Candidatus Contubernalis alkaliaceticus TaxID=338645 RepID=UPI001F4BD81F|nr:XTP/dITP diphosphatase [Candidatus Contubernalis alkalaceticus]UNC90888.1 XTP/dITP diphosphatase [Candidatus Contubernalis alkalaceticus]
MISLVIATRNLGKVKEFKEILTGLPFEVLSLLDFPQCPEIIEDGDTFQENAVIKAQALNDFTECIVLADDSGLEVDYLKGSPGVYSARFAGEGATDEENNKKLLQLMSHVPWEQRGAQFTCVIAISRPQKETVVIKGSCRGIITREPRGNMGFGYDPLFLVQEYGKTFSELGPEIKNNISHRGNAMKKAIEVLKGFVE